MVLAKITGTEVIEGFSMLDVKNKTVSKGIEEIIDVNLVASTPFSLDEHEEDTIPELDLGDSITTSDTKPEVLPFVPTSDTEPEDLPFVPTSHSEPEVPFVPTSDTKPEVLPFVPTSDTEPGVLPFVPTSDTEPEVLLFVPTSDTEPEAIPFVTTSDAEPEVIPFVPTSDAEPEVIPFVPTSDAEPKVIPFVPTSDAVPEVIPFVPTSDAEPEVIPFVPTSDAEPEVIPFVPTSDAEPEVIPFVPTSDAEPKVIPFVPTIRSGSFADIGPRRHMEDEHICIDDLSSHMGSLFTFPSPSAFYGVFDGHGGPDAAAYVKRHAMRFFFDESVFPQASDADNVFIESVECSIRKAFSLADHALADDCTISSSSGTTALAAWVFGRLLLVANAGDCRAVLCRKGEAINMSHDHRPGYTSECERIKSCGGYIDDGYLNGVLSVSRALGDWDMKLPCGSSSALISEPEFTQTLLTEEDEFLIIGCDGIWDVMSSQHAVSIVRRGLRRHDNPEQCARELVREALRLNTFDNLTVVVVCFTRDIKDERKEKEVKLRCCSLSAEALCNLKSWLEN